MLVEAFVLTAQCHCTRHQRLIYKDGCGSVWTTISTHLHRDLPPATSSPTQPPHCHSDAAPCHSRTAVTGDKLLVRNRSSALQLSSRSETSYIASENQFCRDRLQALPCLGFLHEPRRTEYTSMCTAVTFEGDGSGDDVIEGRPNTACHQQTGEEAHPRPKSCGSVAMMVSNVEAAIAMHGALSVMPWAAVWRTTSVATGSRDTSGKPSFFTACSLEGFSCTPCTPYYSTETNTKQDCPSA